MMWITSALCLLAGTIAAWFFMRKELRANNENLLSLRADKLHLEYAVQDMKIALATAQGEADGWQERALHHEARAGALQERLTEQQQDLDKTRQELRMQFENLARQIFEDNSEKFSRQNQNNLTHLLDPLKERIKDFEEKVRTSQKEALEQHTVMKEQITFLRELGIQMSQEARNLTLALKGDNKRQGNWGELVLERVLESSGLQRDREYVVQAHGFALSDGEGKKQIPDVVVKLPEGRHLVIDAKVSLTAYDDAVNCEDDKERQSHLRRHLDSLRRHIGELSQKHYQANQDLQSPDFVFMFLPIETSFSMAIQADGALLEMAWSKKIVPVTPSTLFATLRTVASIWRNDKQSRYAQEIADLGGLIYDQVASFTEEMEKIKLAIDQADNAYAQAMSRLAGSTHSILRRTEKMRRLGARNKKVIGPAYLDNPNLLNDVVLDEEEEDVL